MDDEERLARISMAIADACEGQLVVKWVAVAEVVADDGERYLEHFAPVESSLWDQLGMLDFRRAYLANQIETPGDDG